jgi:hypothetical protein
MQFDTGCVGSNSLRVRTFREESASDDAYNEVRGHFRTYLIGVWVSI